MQLDRLALPCPSCAALGKWLDLSEAQFENTAPPARPLHSCGKGSRVLVTVTPIAPGPSDSSQPFTVCDNAGTEWLVTATILPRLKLLTNAQMYNVLCFHHFSITDCFINSAVYGRFMIYLFLPPHRPVWPWASHSSSWITE